MNKNLPNDTVLAKWLSGALSAKEQQELERHPDFPAWKRIAESTNNWKTPDLDLDASWEQLSNKRSAAAKKVRVRTMMRVWSVAAALAVLVIAAFLLLAETKATEARTAYQEQERMTLPDGSTVTLNANSELGYVENLWGTRNIKLEGEAYFDVEKGKKFIVKTDIGQVEVLGTEFNVVSRDGRFEVVCYEGKVEVSAKNNKMVLVPNERIYLEGELLNKEAFKATSNPTWLSGISSFDKVDLKLVFDELERQYNIQVENTIPTSELRLYKGAFPHNNLEQALQQICEPMNISYEIVNEKQVRIEQKDN